MTPEFSHLVDVRHLPASLRLQADPAQRLALARRFAIEAVNSLDAEVTLERKGDGVEVAGRVHAEVVQHCAIANEPFATSVDEPLFLRFVPAAAAHAPGEEIELDAEDCDEIAFDGPRFDLGEAIAQTLGLAIDPYATGPDADRVRAEAGLADQASAGPFAALAALRSRPD